MAKAKNKPKNKLWGGRFDGAPNALLEAINASIDFDKRLYAVDIAASMAHVRMLADQNIISQADADAISTGLTTIRQEIEDGKFIFKHEYEDIHLNIEARLTELIGEGAGRLHTARSRNDQVATDLRLWLREACDAIDATICDVQKALITQAEQHTETLMPGMTHLQTAQPISFGYHLLAYVEMLGRDRGRFADCRTRLNECPLGAAALAGTAFPIDRKATAKALGFSHPMAHGMDAVASRDFVVEYLAAAAMCATHLSRLAEEIVVWASHPFGFITLSDGFSTGSSIMPQKRNPDAAELVRAKPGRIIGALVGMLTVLKGLPMAYSKDMQEDKEPVFAATDQLLLGLMAMAGMMGDLIANKEAMAAAASHGYATATDLADWLVRVEGVPFREAHSITGKVVALAEGQNKALTDLTITELQSVHANFKAEALAVLDPKKSLAAKTSLGGTAPKQVTAAIAHAKKRFLS